MCFVSSKVFPVARCVNVGFSGIAMYDFGGCMVM